MRATNLKDIYSQTYIFSQNIAAWDVRWPDEPRAPIISMGWGICSATSRPSIPPWHGFVDTPMAWLWVVQACICFARGDARLDKIRG